VVQVQGLKKEIIQGLQGGPKNLKKLEKTRKKEKRL
jgi:hypothetical protein